jgi:hypothetical protein
VVEFNKKVRVMVGLIGGFIGCIGGIIEWRKMDVF